MHSDSATIYRLISYIALPSSLMLGSLAISSLGQQRGQTRFTAFSALSLCFLGLSFWWAAGHPPAASWTLLTGAVVTLGCTAIVVQSSGIKLYRCLGRQSRPRLIPRMVLRAVSVWIFLFVVEEWSFSPRLNAETVTYKAAIGALGATLLLGAIGINLQLHRRPRRQ